MGDPIAEGASSHGGGGKGGASASGGAGTSNAGKPASNGGGGVASGGGGASGGQDGGMGADGGGGAATGGKGGSGGKGGTGGGGSGGKGGGGAGTGGGGRGGSTTGGGGSNGSGGTGGGSGVVNLITNSGFETNTSGWSVFGGSGTITSTTAEAHTGNRSLLITGRTQTYQGPQYSVLDDATPGDSYSLSVWGRLPSSNPTGSLTVTLHYTCSGGSSAGEKYFTWVATAAASASSWVELSGTKAFPACAGGGSMTAASFYVESPSATLSYYIDDVVFNAE